MIQIVYIDLYSHWNAIGSYTKVTPPFFWSVRWMVVGHHSQTWCLAALGPPRMWWVLVQLSVHVPKPLSGKSLWHSWTKSHVACWTRVGWEGRKAEGTRWIVAGCCRCIRFRVFSGRIGYTPMNTTQCGYLTWCHTTGAEVMAINFPKTSCNISVIWRFGARIFQFTAWFAHRSPCATDLTGQEEISPKNGEWGGTKSVAVMIQYLKEWTS